MPTVTYTEVEITEPMPGDVYEDGEVTVYDLTLLSRYITGLEKLSERQINTGDVNNDNITDIKDVVKLAQYLVGMSGVKLMSTAEAVNDSNARVDIDLGSAVADDNGEAYIPVTISGNAGIAGFRFEVNYDHDELEILEIIPSDEISGESFRTNLGSEGDTGLIVSWYQTENMTSDGELFVIHAKYRQDFDGESTKVSIADYENNICNADLESVAAAYSEGNIIRSLEYPFVINDITAYGRDVEISLTNYNGEPAELILAAYDESGIMLGCRIMPIEIESGKSEKLKLELDASSAAYLKAFVWNSSDSMLPLCRVYKKDI